MYIFTPKYDPRKISDKFTNNRSESTQQAAHELTDSCASSDYLSPPSSLPWINKGIIKSPTTTTPANSLIIKVTKDMTKAQYQELRDKVQRLLTTIALLTSEQSTLEPQEAAENTVHPPWMGMSIWADLSSVECQDVLQEERQVTQHNTMDKEEK